MEIQRQQNLLGETVLSIRHDALKEPIEISHEDAQTAYKEMKRLLIVHTKEVLRKYVSVAQNSRGAIFTHEETKAADHIKETRKYIRQDTPLDKFQDKISELIPLMDLLMSNPRSRFYPSQTAKRDFVDQVTIIQIKELTNSKYVHI